MSTIEEKQRQRFNFLNKVYEDTSGNELALISMWNVGNELGWDKETTQLVVQYLVGENLIKHRTLGGGINITHSGVVEIENARSRPNEPTTYFPPIVNMSGDFRGAILNIGSTLSDVNQTISQLSGLDDATKDELEKLIRQLGEILGEIPSEEAEAVAWAAESLVNAAADEKPNRVKVEISKEGLIKAAKNIATVMPTVLQIAQQIV